MSKITATDIISCIRHADLRNDKQLTVKIEWLTELANTIQAQEQKILKQARMIDKAIDISESVLAQSIKNLNPNLGDYLDEEA